MTLHEAAKQIGVPYRTVAGWIERGLIRPKNYVGRQRVKIEIGPKEFRELAIMARLRESLSMQEITKAIRRLRSYGHNPLSTGTFMLFEGEPGKRRLVKLCDNKKEAVELIGNTAGQLLLIPVE